MTINTSAPDGDATSDADTGLFAPRPLWDREPKKRSLFGGSRPQRAAPIVPVTPDAPLTDRGLDAAEAGAGAGVVGATTAAEPMDSAYETQPLRRTAPRRAPPTGAIAAGVAAVAALAGVGWYMAQPHDNGALMMTPGTPAASQVALNTAAPGAAQLPVGATTTTQSTTTQSTRATPASDTAAPRTIAPATAAEPTVRVRTTAARAPAHRARPATDFSAMDTGVNASATAPTTPSAPAAPTPAPATLAPAPVNPVIAPPTSVAPTSPATATPPAQMEGGAAAAPAATTVP
jgi:hypothetical protein